MEMTHEWLDDTVGLIRLSGRLDIPGCQELTLEFTTYTATQRKPVIVDLSEVTLITSMGVGLLLSNAKALHRHGARMVLLNPQPNVEKVLELSGLTIALPIEHNMDLALVRAHGK